MADDIHTRSHRKYIQRKIYLGKKKPLSSLNSGVLTLFSIPSQHLVHFQPPPSTKRSHLLPTTHTHPTTNCRATPLLRQVCGGCYSPGGGRPPTQCRGKSSSHGSQLLLYTCNACICVAMIAFFFSRLLSCLRSFFISPFIMWCFSSFQLYCELDVVELVPQSAAARA